MAKPQSEPNNRLVENNQQTSDNIGLFKEQVAGPSVPSAVAGAYPPGQAGRAVDGVRVWMLEVSFPLRPEDRSAGAGICSTHTEIPQARVRDS